jgi:proteasomal ATPase-associated factor 1
MESIAEVSVQPSVFEVVNDVSKGVVTRETFWASHSAEGKTVYEDIDVCKRGDEVVMEPVGFSGIKVDRESRYMLALRYKDKEYKLRFPRKVYSRYSNDRDLTSVDVSPKGELIAVGDNSGGVEVLSSIDGEVRRRLGGHLIHTTCVKFFASGEVVISAGMDLQLKIWSVVDGSNPRTLMGHKGTVNDIALVGRGRNVLSAASDATVKLWECGSARCVHTFKVAASVNAIILLTIQDTASNGVSELEFETAGKILVAGADDGRIVAWNLATKELVGEAKLSSGVSKLCAISETRFAYGLDNGEVGILDARSLDTPSVTFVKNSARITALTASETTLVVGSDDSTPYEVSLRTNTPTYLGGLENPVTGVIMAQNGSSVHIITKSGVIRTI